MESAEQLAEEQKSYQKEDLKNETAEQMVQRTLEALAGVDENTYWNDELRNYVPNDRDSFISIKSGDY